MSIKPITIFAALALGFAAPAAAGNFTFEYTLLEPGNVVTGSFSGDRAGNSITNISNIAIALNGTSFSGTVNAYGYTGYNGPTGPNSTQVDNFVLGGAIVSFDALESNFLFLNTLPGIDTDDDVFYIFPWNNGGGNQVATQVRLNGVSPNQYNGNLVPANWSLSEVVAPPPGPGPGGIPEPATWAMLLSGFALVGVMARRRSVTVTA
jgi:hypothetical protein